MIKRCYHDEHYTLCGYILHTIKKIHINYKEINWLFHAIITIFDRWNETFFYNVNNVGELTTFHSHFFYVFQIARHWSQRWHDYYVSKANAHILWKTNCGAMFEKRGDNSFHHGCTFFKNIFQNSKCQIYPNSWNEPKEVVKWVDTPLFEYNHTVSFFECILYINKMTLCAVSCISRWFSYCNIQKGNRKLILIPTAYIICSYFGIAYISIQVMS